MHRRGAVADMRDSRATGSETGRTYGEAMSLLNLLTIAAYFLLPGVVIALMLFVVIRAAVLSALRKHAAEQAASIPLAR